MRFGNKIFWMPLISKQLMSKSPSGLKKTLDFSLVDFSIKQMKSGSSPNDFVLCGHAVIFCGLCQFSSGSMTLQSIVFHAQRV